jgi:succinate dehydrogenase / fumarate reductase cytochrome b subunit
MQELLRKNYFLIRRTHSILGLIPFGVFFLMHMFLNSRAAQSPEQYQWVPDTLDQVPYLWAIEIFGLLLPMLAHAVLGVWIALSGDYGGPAKVRSFGGNIAYIIQRVTGVLLLVMVSYHVWQTWWVHKATELAGEHFEIYPHMSGIVESPLWLGLYAVFVLIAAWHFGFGVYNFAYRWGFATSKNSQRAALALGLGLGLLGLIMGWASLWGLAFSPWAKETLGG